MNNWPLFYDANHKTSQLQIIQLTRFYWRMNIEVPPSKAYLTMLQVGIVEWIILMGTNF